MRLQPPREAGYGGARQTLVPAPQTSPTKVHAAMARTVLSRAVSLGFCLFEIVGDGGAIGVVGHGDRDLREVCGGSAVFTIAGVDVGACGDEQLRHAKV